MAKITDTDIKQDTVSGVPVAAKFPSNIPEIAAEDGIIPSVEPVPELSAYKGTYIKKDDGEVYAIARLETARDDKTVFALNSRHFWNGTDAEFRLGFDEKK